MKNNESAYRVQNMRIQPNSLAGSVRFFLSGNHNNESITVTTRWPPPNEAAWHCYGDKHFWCHGENTGKIKRQRITI